MALQTSGQISLNDIHVEAGGTSGTSATINDSDIRGLTAASGYTIPTGSGTTIDFGDFYGASSSVDFNITAATWYTGKGSRDNHGYQSGLYTGGNSTMNTSMPVTFNGATFTVTMAKWFEFSGWAFAATLSSGTWSTTGWNQFVLFDDNDDLDTITLERSTVTSQIISGNYLSINWPDEGTGPDYGSGAGNITWQMS